jgi:hypothetical protein
MHAVAPHDESAPGRAPAALRTPRLAVSGATLLYGAFVLGSALSRTEVVVAPPAVIVPPPQVTVAPAPVVMPPTPVVLEPPAPPPPPATPSPAAPPRALAPFLDPACVVTIGGATSPTCAWDDGFPAISADGTVIATRYTPPTGSSDLFGLSIHFIDTKTSRVVRDSVILTPEESATFLVSTAESEQLAETQQRAKERLLGKIYRRVAAVQQALDAQHFRTLHALATSHASMSDDQPPSQRGPDPVYAEIAGTAARIIDSTASTVLWRGDFWATGPKRTGRGGSDCDGWTPWSMALWWDPETRYVLAAQTYRTGGCMCPDVPIETVQQMH